MLSGIALTVLDTPEHPQHVPLSGVKHLCLIGIRVYHRRWDLFRLRASVTGSESNHASFPLSHYGFTMASPVLMLQSSYVAALCMIAMAVQDALYRRGSLCDFGRTKAYSRFFNDIACNAN